MSNVEPFKDLLNDWRDDDIFAEQRLSGCNPMVLRRVTEDSGQLTVITWASTHVIPCGVTQRCAQISLLLPLLMIDIINEPVKVYCRYTHVILTFAHALRPSSRIFCEFFILLCNHDIFLIPPV